MRWWCGFCFGSCRSLAWCERMFASCLLLTRFPCLCAYLSTVYSFFFYLPVATAHRWNDPKTLSCQESTLPSTFTRAGGLRSFAFGVHDECYPENKVKKEMKKMIIQLVSLGNSRSFQSRTYLMGRSLEGVWPGRMPTCSSWMNWILIPFEGCVMLISYGFKLHQQVAQEL